MVSENGRRFSRSGPLVLVALLVVPGVTIGSEADGQAIDPATQAAWLADHFRIEHAAEMMAQTVTIDPATQAAWLADHFRIEHAAEIEGS